MEEQRKIEDFYKLAGVKICWSEAIACTRCNKIQINLTEFINHEKDCQKNYLAQLKVKRKAEKSKFVAKQAKNNEEKAADA